MDMSQLQGLLSFAPTPEDKQKAMTYGLIGAGLGILSANAQNPRGAGFGGALGGAMPGLQMYQQALTSAPRERLQNAMGSMQLSELQRKIAQQEALRGMNFTDPAARQFAAAGLFEKAIDRENPQQKFMGVGDNLVDVTPGRAPTSVFSAPSKPQLVDMPVPGQPGITQPTWLRPGESSGVSVGGMKMPEILNPQIQQAKRDIARAGATNVSVSTGVKKVDEKFAQDFVDFATGGYADTVKQIDQLREVSKNLGTTGGLTGPIVGNIPRGVRNVVAPESVATQESVEEVVQRNLRLVLGAQFTEKEGERLISRAYNPALSQAENKKRVDRLVQQIESAAQSKLDASRYFMANGTLEGWKGKVWTMSDFDPDKTEPTEKPRRRSTDTNVMRFDSSGRPIQ